MATLTIERISFPEYLCPLLEVKKDSSGKQIRVTHFNITRTSIHESNKKVPSVPIVCSPENSTLEVAIKDTLSAYKGELWDFQATYPRQRDATTVQESLFDKQSNLKFAPAASNGLMVLKCPIAPPKSADGTTRNLPWIFGGPVTWALIFDGGKKKYEVKIDIELYVLPSHVPKYMISAGIPLDLLRLGTILPRWAKMFDTKLAGYTNDWPAFVIDALFNDARLWYDTFSGASTYCSYGHNQDTYYTSPNRNCWLELWLSDMNGLAGSAGASKLQHYSINCLDTAGLGQTIASLGLEKDTMKMRMVFMAQYGFIKSTYLIGRHKNMTSSTYSTNDLCNNPFYSDAQYMLLNAADPARQTFNLHFFLVLDDGSLQQFRVYEACCGPQKGLLTLPGYVAGPNSAIDRDPAIYSPNTYSLNNQTFLRPQGPGVLSDGFIGPGITSLASATSFTRSSPVASSSSSFSKLSLFERME